VHRVVDVVHGSMVDRAKGVTPWFNLGRSNQIRRWGSHAGGWAAAAAFQAAACDAIAGLQSIQRGRGLNGGETVGD
jgi:hypothetical protein